MESINKKFIGKVKSNSGHIFIKDSSPDEFFKDWRFDIYHVKPGVYKVYVEEGGNQLKSIFVEFEDTSEHFVVNKTGALNVSSPYVFIADSEAYSSYYQKYHQNVPQRLVIYGDVTGDLVRKITEGLRNKVEVIFQKVLGGFNEYSTIEFFNPSEVKEIQQFLDLNSFLHYAFLPPLVDELHTEVKKHIEVSGVSANVVLDDKTRENVIAIKPKHNEDEDGDFIVYEYIKGDKRLGIEVQFDTRVQSRNVLDDE